MFDFKKLKKYNGRKAVSPVVATLILIIVAIVGAVAVGLIVSGIGNQTSKNANAGGAASQSQTQLFIGGSTTVFPVVEAAQGAYQTSTGTQLVVSQGGSDAGMQGVLSGALDIGMASSAGAVNNLENAVVSQSLTGVTVNPTLIGGSAVVVIENGGSTGAGTTGFLLDGANVCLGITAAALKAIYTLGTISITAGGCAAASPTFSTLDAGSVVAGATYTAVSRSDNSGTQDQFSSFTGLTKQSAGGNLPGVTQSGNPGVLNYVNTHTGTIGFVDLGFAEGAASGAVCPAGHVAVTTCGVAIPQTDGKSPTALPVSAGTGSAITSGNGYVSNDAANWSTAKLESLVKTALKTAATTNPLTLAGQIPTFPDSQSPGTGLARTFYLVTNGVPNTNEQRFITFITNFNAETYFTSNGYYSQYDFTAA
jgi:phosphate transport system substrate-binding protein